jgi:hypothetical protein
MFPSAYCIVIVILLCLVNAYVIFARFSILEMCHTYGCAQKLIEKGERQV